MHISEGILNTPILLTSSILIIGVVAYMTKRLDIENIGKVSAFSALFFVASFIHIPIGPTSIHLVLSGIIGAFLGFDAILAIFIALLFQGVFFGYGGITTLGINTIIISFPAVLGFYIYKKDFRLAGFFAGSIPIFISALLLSLTLLLNGEEFENVAKLAFLANIPLVVLEGIITFFAIKFLERVKV